MTFLDFNKVEPEPHDLRERTTTGWVPPLLHYALAP